MFESKCCEYVISPSSEFRIKSPSRTSVPLKGIVVSGTISIEMFGLFVVKVWD